MAHTEKGGATDNQITLGSLFDGIGVFPLAARQNGIVPRGEMISSTQRYKALGNAIALRGVHYGRNLGGGVDMTHDFLEETALKYGCFISDLKLVPSLRRAAIYDLLHAKPGKYPLDQWREYACYLTGSTRKFETIPDARAYLSDCLTEWRVIESVI